ncbi:MAG: dienelactone hydrolase family protein [Planctomycetes bacterium]|nr:dienelactone hydrolase family protein [Planctomycetota bacterium]
MSGSPRRIEVRFGTSTGCLCVPAAEAPDGRRPPLLVAFHGHGQDGARHARWMGAAAPPRFAAAFPDGLFPFEVRRPGRPIRIGHAWYVFDGDREHLAAELAGVGEVVWTIIDTAARELHADRSRVWLAGFSQGTYLVHVLALSRPERVAGWIAQAGGFRPEYLGGRALPRLDGRPVLLQHGEHDEALPVARSHEIAELLGGLGADVTLETYDAGHAITPAMADAARRWLDAREA